MAAKKKSIKKESVLSPHPDSLGVYVWEAEENGKRVFLVRIHEDGDPLKRGYIIDGPRPHREYAEYMADQVRLVVLSIIEADTRRIICEG